MTNSVWVCINRPQVAQKDTKNCDHIRADGSCSCYGMTNRKPCDAVEYREVNKPCKWSVDKDGVWFTDCHNAFEFNNYDGPEKNGMKYCPYCGALMSEEKG